MEKGFRLNFEQAILKKLKEIENSFFDNLDKAREAILKNTTRGDPLFVCPYCLETMKTNPLEHIKKHEEEKK